MSIVTPTSVETLLQQMVRIDTVNTTVSGNPLAEAKLTAYLESLAQSWGMKTRRLPVPGRGDNLLVTPAAAPDPAAQGLVFMSHIDTVATAGMTIDPLSGEIKDGRVWGRGSSDTKGTGASMLWAFKQYLSDKGPKRNVAIVFTLDEEYGMLGVRHFISNGWNELGFKARGVIVGEPTRLQPIIAHNGIARWKIVTQGVASHSATPANGRSAISDMMRVVQRIESVYIPSLTAHHAMTGKAQASVNLISGGSQVNIIPDRCEVTVDRRVTPGEVMADVLPAVERELDVLRAADKSLRVHIEPLFMGPPSDPVVAAPLLPWIESALVKQSLPTQTYGKPYGTEAGDLSAAGIPAIVIGPGDLAQAHTKDEWVLIEQLHLGVEFYLSLMLGR